MTRLLFACDIDNTLIYSHRHPHPGWPCVEWIGEREQAYMSPATHALFPQVLRRMRTVLVTSRSVAQYMRLRLPGDGCMAVTANGADLLVRGVPDPDWRRESDALLAPWRDRMRRCLDAGTQARWRIVDGACLVARCPTDADPRAEVGDLARRTGMNAFVLAGKCYLFPPPLDKGRVVDRLLRRLRCDGCVAAGDSDMDLPMLGRADAAIAPAAMKRLLPETAQICPEDRLFSEFVLERALAWRCPRP